MKIYLFLTFLSLISCEKNENEIEKWIGYAQKLDKNYDSKSIYVFIPNAGCPGCLSTAEAFLLDNLNSKSIKFVLFQVHSKKELNIKLGQDVFSAHNVLIDNYFLSDHLQLNSFYPIILFQEFKRLEEISPHNPDSLDDLKDLLSN